MAESAVLDAPPATPPAAPPASALPTTDWRTSLGADIKDHAAIKELKTPDDAVKALIAARDWRSGLPDDLKNNDSIKNAKDVADLAKMYIGAQAKIGQKGVIIPGKDAKPEEIAAFHEALGRPKTPAEYQAPKENMPEGVPLDETLLKDFSTEAHALGLNPGQYAELVRFQANAVAKQREQIVQQQQEAVAAAEAELRKEYGGAYDQNMRLAKDAIKSIGDPSLLKFLDDTGLGNNPALIRAMAKFGRQNADDPIVGGGHHQSFVPTPLEAQSKINAKYQDVEFMKAYSNPGHPGHAGALAEMTGLFKVANPEEPKK